MHRFTFTRHGITFGEALHKTTWALETKGFGALELTHRRAG